MEFECLVKEGKNVGKIELDLPLRSKLSCSGEQVFSRELTEEEIYALSAVFSEADLTVKKQKREVFYEHLGSTEPDKKFNTAIIAIEEGKEKVFFFLEELLVSITIMLPFGSDCSECNDITCSKHPGH